MTIYLNPNISQQQIDELSVFDAFRLAEELLESRFPRDAARVARKVADAEPGTAAGWELLGRAHFAAAQLSAAEAAFRQLIELEPTSAWAHTALGLSLDRQSRHREGALLHKLAAAMGASERDETRVQLVDNATGVTPF